MPVPIQRHFLGWERPVVDLVAERLLEGAAGTPPDLGATLVMVQTRQGGRRLRERLAALSPRGLLSPRVVTPEFWLRPRGPVLSEIESLAVWAALLADVTPADFPQALPGAEVRRDDSAWRLSVAGQFQQLRRLLSDGGHTVGSAAAQLADGEEATRWQELAALETLYLARVEAAGAGRLDPVSAELAAAAAPELPPGVARLVLAAVPDPSPLALRAIAALAGRLPIEVWIHAPAPGGAGNGTAGFDDWGRPDPAWQGRELPIEEARLHLAAKPHDQAATVRQMLPPLEVPVGELGLGVLDSEVGPHLLAELGAEVPVFDPAERPLVGDPTAGLVQSLLLLHASDEYSAFSDLVRNPHFLTALRGEVADFRPLLDGLDTLQNESLAQSFTAIERAAQAGDGTGEDRAGARRKAVGAVCASVRRLLDPLGADPTDALPGVLASFYANAAFERPAAGGPPVFQAAVDALLTLLDDVRAPLVRDCLPAPPDRSALLLSTLARRGLAPEPPDNRPRIDLEGWLELHWNDAPRLIITGFNEGKVPQAVTADPFLPDPARVRLGLPSNETRLARDTYLLAAMLACRRGGGTLDIVFGKSSMQGDALKPSRLLFRCADADLPGRVLRLSGKAPPPRPAAPMPVRFRPPWRGVPDALHVTAFRGYLACPFRFYLAQVVGMAALDDRKLEWDAADFGTVCHRVLADFARDPATRDLADEARIAAALEACLNALLGGRGYVTPSATLLVQADMLRQRLRHAAAAQAQAYAEGWRIVEDFVESRFEGEVAGLPITGTVDRVDRNVHDGRIRILDYKTTSEAARPAAAHLAKDRDGTRPYARFAPPPSRPGGKPPAAQRWTDLQLPLYALLLRDRLAAEAPPAVGYFCMPKAVTETGIRMFDTLDETMLASAKACAEGVVTDIRARRFWPPSRRVEHDDFKGVWNGNWEAVVDLTGWPGAPHEEEG